MDEREQWRLYKERWDIAGPMLDEVHRRELREMDQRVAIAQLDGAIQWAVEHTPKRTTSGLVEQQRLFMIWAERHGLKKSGASK